MFYLKTTIDGVEREVELYDDEIFTKCLDCGKEIQVDDETLAEILKDGDFVGTSIVCEECVEKRKTPRFMLVKGGRK